MRANYSTLRPVLASKNEWESGRDEVTRDGLPCPRGHLRGGASEFCRYVYFSISSGTDKIA
jgi:hypothetical protein